MWGVSIPVAMVALHLWANPDSAVNDCGGLDAAVPITWWAVVCGMAVSDFLMVVALLRGDWQALSDEAVRLAAEEDEPADIPKATDTGSESHGLAAQSDRPISFDLDQIPEEPGNLTSNCCSL